MAKVVVSQIKLQIEAGQASPAPPVGPALGQHNVPIMDFVRQFNDRTSKMEPGTVIAGCFDALRPVVFKLDRLDEEI